LLAGVHFLRHPQTTAPIALPSLALPPFPPPVRSSSPLSPPQQAPAPPDDADLVEVVEASALPRWVRPPAPDASDYPIKALRAGASGEAVITCFVSPLGRPTGCEIASETPPGL